jgi:hypothetical protein
MPGGGALGRLRHRRLAALASLASATTEAQTAAARTELEQIDAQLQDHGESGRLVIEQTSEELQP